MFLTAAFLGTLFCSGFSTSFDLKIEMDGQAGTILVEAIDSDATYPGFERLYQGLTWKEGCLQSPRTSPSNDLEIRLCLTETGFNSLIEMKLPQSNGRLFLEKGWVDCRP